jgi:hypothetical protein
VKTVAKQRARLKANVVGMPEKGDWRMRRRRGRRRGRRKMVRIFFSSIFFFSGRWLVGVGYCRGVWP